MPRLGQFSHPPACPAGEHSSTRREKRGAFGRCHLLLSRMKASTSWRDHGAVTAMTGLALVPVLMVSAVVVDGGRVFVERQKAQTAAESGALSGAAAWASGLTPCASSVDGIAKENAGSSAVVGCSSSGGPVGGQVNVSIDLPVPTFFSGLLGRNSTVVEASASARLGGALSVRGLRPLALCVDAPAVTEWVGSGFTDSGVKRIGVDSSDGTCADGVPGNWAVVDFNGGANSNAEARQWITSGYPGEVDVPSTLSGDPGIPSPALDLDDVIGETVFVPLYKRAYLEGSNARFDLVSYASVTIVDARLSGSASGRYVDVIFRRAATVGRCCVSDALNVGVLVPQVCSLDNQGVCPR